MQTVWVTKYVLTDGIFEAQVNDKFRESLYVMFKDKCGNNRKEWLNSNQWESEKNVAVLNAEKMRAKKIASLEDQIERLRALEF